MVESRYCPYSASWASAWWHDLRIAERVQAVADQVRATSAQVALAWLPTLTALPLAEGGHHTDEQMQVIER